MPIEPYYHAIKDITFTSREPFVRAVAELVESSVAEVGGAVSIRQVYYRAVNAGLVQSGDQGYRQIGAAIKDGRISGLVAWNVIEDRGRAAKKPYHEESVGQALRNLAEHYRLDRAAGQRFRIEVWLEQAALGSILWPVCAELGCLLVVCGGFTSHDSLFKASERQRGYKSLGQQGIILHLSDLDPSGVQMADSIREIVGALSGQEIVVQRVGLTKAQALRHRLLARPLKSGDSRAAAYREEHGDVAYELDGLPAYVLQQLVRETVEPMIDWTARGQVLAVEEEDKAKLRELLAIARDEGMI
jgi:hypothetical protein